MAFSMTKRNKYFSVRDTEIEKNSEPAFSKVNSYPIKEWCNMSDGRINKNPVFYLYKSYKSMTISEPVWMDLGKPAKIMIGYNNLEDKILITADEEGATCHHRKRQRGRGVVKVDSLSVGRFLASKGITPGEYTEYDYCPRTNTASFSVNNTEGR